MLSLKFLALALCAIPLVLAQPNGTLIGIEAIKAHFAQAALVPAFLPRFNPSALLTATFQGLGNITAGQVVSKEQVLHPPTLSLTAANSSMAPQGIYTIIMADAGAPGSDQSHGQWRHWLVNGATILSSTNSTVNTVGAGVVTQYIQPNPPVGDGPHRYVILVFAQPADFLPPPNLSQANTGGGIFKVQDYLGLTKLGDPIAGTYFTCQQGHATGTIPPTSPVVSETLPGWKTTGTGAQPTSAVAQKTNSGLSATRNALALFLTPLMGLIAL